MAGEDSAYLDWIRSHPCAVDRCGESAIHAHHRTGRKGMSQRAHDHQAMPLCWKHHRQLHDLAGFFAGWTGERLADWQDEQVAFYHGVFTNQDAF